MTTQEVTLSDRLDVRFEDLEATFTQPTAAQLAEAAKLDPEEGKREALANKPLRIRQQVAILAGDDHQEFIDTLPFPQLAHLHEMLFKLAIGVPSVPEPTAMQKLDQILTILKRDEK